MSERALRIYEEALKRQHTLNEARRIRTKVDEAQGVSAGHRWPFELLQNALDPGPRIERSSVNICFRFKSSTISFEHDGIPFTSNDLAALLSGGSSKEYESASTTGRFGTGFLVTHVLAKRTELRGLLELERGCEQFNLVLDRSGDEEAILKNIYDCNDAILAAQPINGIDELPTAIFQYSSIHDATLNLGIEALRQSLPYLFLTRPILGRVELDLEGNEVEVWKPREILRDNLKDGFVEYRTLHIERNGFLLLEICVFRFMAAEDSLSSALAIVEKVKEGWQVRLPEINAPRIYREYPLRESGFVPISFILDGKFDPDQERNRVKMIEKDKELLKEGLAASVVGVKYAFEQKWKNAHLLATAHKPISAFVAGDAEEKEWWTDQLATFAGQLARLPIIECNSGFLPAISEDTYADFVIPRLLNDPTGDETTVERMWPLVEEATDLFPPINEIALDWTKISEGWQSLGLELNLVTVSSLAKYVREDAEALGQLRVDGDAKEWLAKFLDIVGECWINRQGVEFSAIVGILPNQNEHLCSAKELHQDGGVSEPLKDICSDMGLDIRKRLLLEDIKEIAKTTGLGFVDQVIATAIPEIVSEDDVIDEGIRLLEAKLPEDKECPDETLDLQKASVRLLHYLWEVRGKGCESIAKKTPLITSNQRVAKWGPKKMMMAPVCTWHESARLFANAYPPDRVLHELYVGSEVSGIPNCVQALLEWGIAFGDPITGDEPAELKGDRLAAISSGDTEGLVVKGEKFSQIALLMPDVLNRCQEGIEEACALLGLVLCHVAPHDDGWQKDCIVIGRKSNEEVSVPLRSGALWLADLKFKAWVPIKGEDGKTAKVHADETTLKPLLDSAWLQKNDAAIRLLRDWFGFDELDLRLLGIADEEKRKELRNGLAKLLESGGADPEFYEKLADEIEARRRRGREVEWCRKLGMAIQAAIKSAMEGYGLTLELIDVGFDYEVTMDNILEETATLFKIGPYLLEVKATTVGEVRLTPKQAETASKEPARYVLCVVDLRNLSEEELNADWIASGVEPLAKVVPDIGNGVAETCFWIEGAKTNPVTIRNDSALRYGVPVSIWEEGVSISEWVKQISGGLTKPAGK